MPLNDRQQRFVNEYLANGGNGTQAAIAAGYSERSAEVTASKLLRNAKVSEAVKAGQSEIKDHLCVTAEWKREQLRRIIENCTQFIETPSSKGDEAVMVSAMLEPKAAISAIAELNKMDGDLATIKTDTKISGELSTRNVVIIKNLTGRQPESDD